MRLSRSSPTSSSIAAARSASGLTCLASSSRATCSCFLSCILRWRSRSMARCFAVAMSHAPGLSGTPAFGHCSSAMTRASCARSSAMPTSPTSRARPAMSLADSIRQTPSIASAALFGGIHHLAHFHFQLLIPKSDVGLQELPRPLDGLLLRRDIVDGKPTDDFLGLGKGPICHGDLPVGESRPRSRGGRQQTPHLDHHAFLRCVFAEFHDRLNERRRGLLSVLARLHDRHESHGHFPGRCLFFSITARCRSSCLRSSGVNASPKSSASKTWRISTSSP